MADLEFTQQNIQDLTRKLATLDAYLSDTERDLLLAIFAAAAERAKPYGTQHGGTLPQATSPGPPPQQGAGTGQQANLQSLQQQLLCAYIPGNSFDSVTQGGLTDRITGTGGSAPGGATDRITGTPGSGAGPQPAAESQPESSSACESADKSQPD